MTLCLLSTLRSSSQGAYQNYSSQTLTSLPSPNATDLGRYGDIPLSGHTGRAEVTVPLYSFTQRGVTLDVSLSYDTSGLLISQLPGCVGHGWTLNAGGCITRTMNQIPDEFVYDSSTNNCYFKLCGQMPPVGNETPDFLCGNMKDFMPDVFHFNFMGKSGYFLLGNDGNWKVYSESNLTVAFNATSSIYEIRHDTTSYAYPFVRNICDNPDYPSPKSIKGFTLLDDDGTRYEFGGTTDATEYSTDLFHTADNEFTAPWIATSWYLTRVLDRHGNVLFKFDYSRDYFMVQLNSVEYYERFSSGPIENEAVCLDALSGTLNAPVRLNSITTFDKRTLHFSYINAFGNEQVSKIIYPSLYDDDGTPNGRLIQEYWRSHLRQQPDKMFFYLQDLHNAAIRQCQAPSSVSRDSDPLSSIGMRVLSKIVIKDSLFVGGRRYDFSYNTTGRIHLSGIDIYGSGSSRSGKYTFEYNGYHIIPADYLSNNYDHWGFYRPPQTPISIQEPDTTDIYINSSGTGSKSAPSIIDYFSAYDSLRVTSLTASQCGTLNKITYPTGGCTKLEYESNNYSHCISDNHLTVESEIGNAGGVRVKSIADYETPTSTTPLKKRMFNYNIPGTSTSSGTLYAKPKYVFSWQTQRANGNGTVNMTTCRSVPIRPLANSHGPHIGYSYVTETDLEGNRTVYHYSNIEDAMDERFTYTMSGTAATPFDKFSEKGFKRGRLLSAETYSPDNVLMSSIVNTYRGSDAEETYVYASNMFYYQNYYYANVSYYGGGTYKIFYPKYDLVRTVTSTRHSGVMVRDTLEYTHIYDDAMEYHYDNKVFHANIGKLTSVMKKRGSDRLGETYPYPFGNADFTNGYFLPALSSEQRLNNVFMQKEATEWTLFNGQNQPEYEIQYVNGATVPDTITHYLSYTPSGLPREYTIKGKGKTTLLWSNEGCLLAEVRGDINPDLLVYEVTPPSPSGGIVNLDSLPYQSEITLKYDGVNVFSIDNVSAKVYTYDTKGNIISIISGNGKKEYYEYDKSGRLVKVNNEQMQTRQKFNYHYKTGN